MIDFRYHLVSLTALFLALAGGIALGAGPLQDPVRGQLSAAASTDDVDALRSQLDDAHRLGDFQGAYDTGTARLVLGGRLAGTAVSLIVLPGADPTTVADLGRYLALADARVVSTVRVSDELLDPARRQLAESLAQRVLRGVDGAGAADGATGYPLVGATLARALLTGSTGSTGAVVPDGASASIQAAFEEANFLTVRHVADRRAALALVVSGDIPAAAPDGQADVVAGILAGLDRADAGTVLVGTTSSAEDGAVAAVRASDQAAAGVSTVGGVENATGRLVGVLALAEQASGGTGQYGPGAPDGALPRLGKQTPRH